MKESLKARQWRLVHDLSPRQLSALIGYSVESIHAMERGETPAGKGSQRGPVKPNVWRRYKCACAAVDAHLRLSHNFDWSAPQLESVGMRDFLRRVEAEHDRLTTWRKDNRCNDRL